MYKKFIINNNNILVSNAHKTIKVLHFYITTTENKSSMSPSDRK